jgi:hypothetical protein
MGIILLKTMYNPVPESLGWHGKDGAEKRT